VGCCLAAQQALTGHDWPGGIAVGVRMGLHSGEPGDPLPAARLAGAAEGIRQQSGTLRTDLEEARMERYLTSARATVTPQAWTAELAAGRALTQHEAVILLLSPSPAGSTSA
jgi:hypothetical protein